MKIRNIGWLCLAVACGGAPSKVQQPGDAQDPTALLEDEPEASAVPASSAQVQRGIDAIVAEDYATAKLELEQAVAADAQDPQAVYYLGVAEAGLGDGQSAVSHWRRALELQPRFAEASLNLSATLLELGQTQEALEVAEQGLQAAPGDAGLLLNQALALSSLERPAEAAAVFAQLVEKQPKDEVLRFSYAEALIAAQEQDAGIQELERLMGSQNREVLASVADLFGRTQQWDQCIAALNKAIEIEAASELLVRRGLCRHEKQDEDGAKADFDRAIEIDPRSGKAHFYLGHNLRARGDKAAAKAAFSRAQQLEGDSPIGKAAARALKQL